MAEYSTQLGPDDVCISCKQGNQFLCQMPQEMQDKLQLRGFVNGKHTPILPVGEVHTLINKKEESINKVELMIDGKKKTLIKDLSEFGELQRPEDIKVFIGANKPKPPQQHRNRTEYAMQTTALQGTGVFAFEIADSAGLGLGPVNKSDLTPEQKSILGSQLAPIFGLNITKIKDAYESWPSELAQTIIGAVEERLEASSSAATAAASVAATTRAMPQAMRLQIAIFEELVVSQTLAIKQIEGKLILAFKTQLRYSTLVVTKMFPIGGITAIDARAQATSTSSQLKSSQLKSTATGTFKGTGGVFLLIGCSLIIAEFLSKEEGEQFLTDLFIDLSVNIAIAVVSAVGVIALGILVGAGAALASPTLLVTVVVGGITLGASMLLGKVWEVIADDVKQKARKFIPTVSLFFSDSWNSMVVEPIAKEIHKNTNHNLPGGDLQLLDVLMRSLGGRGIP